MSSSSADLPASYASLGYDDITVSHVPASSTAVTKVVVVTLNRPHKYNAVTLDMLVGLEAIFNTSAPWSSPGGQGLFGGADLNVGFMAMTSLKESDEMMRDFRDWYRPPPRRGMGGRLALAIAGCKKPTVVAINGPAVGVGLTMTLPATIRVAWEGAKCGVPFARRGLVLESCSAFYLPRLIGLSKASHVAATGDVYPVSDPLVSGLFSKLLPSPEETVRYAVHLAEDLAENTSLVSTKLMRDMMTYGPPSPEGAHILDSRVFVQLAGTADNIEGVKSFLEKRKPNFTDSLSRESVPFWPWWDRDTGRYVSQLERAAKL
ncbi:enoyl-CoA hydratase/isomerase [Colletotrichum tofieldiae]|nr:enoyl-CoA hydratase/isomerase [Colletotrichum tofieldiae]